MAEKISGVKVTLSSKKVVCMRVLKIVHFELAVKAVGSRAKGNAVLQQVMTNKELLKILLYSIDGKIMSPTDCEDLDVLFTIAEYQQLQQVINELAGAKEDDGGGDFVPKIETALFGDK